MMFFTQADIIDRLQRIKYVWYHGPPSVHLEGKEGEFGHIIFDFGYIVKVYGIRLTNKEEILDIATLAIMNFAE